MEKTRIDILTYFPLAIQTKTIQTNHFYRKTGTEESKKSGIATPVSQRVWG